VFPAEEDHGFTPETDPWRRYPLQEGPKPRASAKSLVTT
jgi:hypothetical protein